MTGLSSLVSIVGSLIVAAAAVVTTKVTLDRQAKAANAARRDRIVAVIGAIRDELEAVFDRYKQTMRTPLTSLAPGQGLGTRYVITGNYFVVFEANAGNIGLIEDADLRRAIVRTYVLGKGFVDSFRYNNVLIDKCEQTRRLALHTTAALDNEAAEAAAQELAQYAQVLQSDACHFEASYHALMQAIPKALKAD